MSDERSYVGKRSMMYDEDSRNFGVDGEPKKVTTPTERESAGPRTVNGRIANASKVRVRKRPSLTADVVTILEEGTSLKILNKDGDFYRVRFNTNEIGYIHQSYCEEV